jgi:hypothetical protein
MLGWCGRRPDVAAFISGLDTNLEAVDATVDTTLDAAGIGCVGAACLHRRR